MTGTGSAAELDPDRAWSGFARHHAFIIGIDNYRTVAPLRTAVNDATRLAELLRDQHGFEVHGPLLDATGGQIRELLTTTLKDEVRANDRVLFYFAGHGVAADGEDGPAGYLVPADAEKTELSTYIPMADLQAALDALPCRHLLLILDCCFSGSFKWSTRHRAITGLMPKRIYAQRFARFVEDPARQIITSAAYDQKALDVLNGQATGERGSAAADDGRLHSPFALALFDALNGEADVKLDREGDGVITATEIYAFVRDRIEPATLKEGARLRQTPSFFPLKGHDKGEFMFRNPRHRFNMPPMQGQSPFKGLASFDENDRHLFYGRDRVVADLAKRAADPAQRLLVVVGPSGTGKSSVIKAGLLPQLKDDGLTVVVMRPGAHPQAELAKALDGHGGPLVLIVDQFEELITRCADDAERRSFDARLRELLDANGLVQRIVVTVRSDFEPQLNGGALKEAWRTGRFTVPPFSLDELRQVIVMPTIQEVMLFEPAELVDQIIGEVVQSPGALPLLSYTLNELFQAYVRRGGDKRDLTQADYDQLGGVMGALRTKADALYRELASDAERDTMRKIMLRMVSVEGELAGRRVPVSDLVFPNVEPAGVGRVIERLVDARLVVRTEGGVEPAHDALVRAWKTLRDWIHDTGKDKLILGEQLQIAAADHLRTGNAEYLWNTNPNLPAVQALVHDTQRCWFSTHEVEFIRASVRRKSRRLRMTVGITAGVLATLTLLMVWGWVEQRRAAGSIAGARDFTDDLLGSQMKKLRAIAQTHEVRKDLVTQVSGLNNKLVAVGAEDDHVTRFWTQVLEGDVELERRQFATARAKFEEAIRIATPLQASAIWQRNLSIALGQLGDLALQAGPGHDADPAQARHRFQEALAIDQRLVEARHGDRVARRDLFISHFRLGDLDRRDAELAYAEGSAEAARPHWLAARQHFDQALPLAEGLLAEQPDDAEGLRDLTRVLVELGNVAFDLAGDAADAEGQRAHDLFARAVGLAETAPDAVLLHEGLQTQLSTSYGRLAILRSDTGQLASARDAVQKALTIVQRPAVPVVRNDLPSEAERQHDRVASLKTLSEIESKAQDWPAARAALRNALQIAEAEAARPGAEASWTDMPFLLWLKLGETEVAAASNGQRAAGSLKAARESFRGAARAASAPLGRAWANRCAKTPSVPCEPAP